MAWHSYTDIQLKSLVRLYASIGDWGAAKARLPILQPNLSDLRWAWVALHATFAQRCKQCPDCARTVHTCSRMQPLHISANDSQQ